MIFPPPGKLTEVSIITSNTKHMRSFFITFLSLVFISNLGAQTEPGAGKWKTWLISSGKEFRLPAPSGPGDINAVIKAQKNIDDKMKQQIQYWGAGSPGYRWTEMISKLWIMDTSYKGMLSNMLVSVGIYDATIAAWDTKYEFNTKRPYETDKRVRALVPKPESPSYPCEYSVAAGVATTVISHFYPFMKDSVMKLASQLMEARVASGVQFPRDTKDGFELGKKIAETEIARTKNFIPETPWDGKMPQEPGVWKGQKPMFPLAGKAKPMVLESGSEFRPAPPPDFKKEMEELKNFKPNFRSNANAYLHASQAVLTDILDEKIFEHNLHLNPPRAARIYAMHAIGTYDGFISCWDAKYAYWGIRPTQYDSTYKSLIGTPPFPGYPSGHAMLSSVHAELLSYFFPADQVLFRQKAKDIAESRFHAGIHFRSDNDVANEMGKQIAAKIIGRLKSEGIE